MALSRSTLTWVSCERRSKVSSGTGGNSSHFLLVRAGIGPRSACVQSCSTVMEYFAASRPSQPPNASPSMGRGATGQGLAWLKHAAPCVFDVRDISHFPSIADRQLRGRIQKPGTVAISTVFGLASDRDRRAPKAAPPLWSTYQRVVRASPRMPLHQRDAVQLAAASPG